MLIKIVVHVFGGFWSLRERLIRARSPVVRRFYQALYEAYLDHDGSYIGQTARFDGPPVFPHGPKGIFISGGAVVGKNCVLFQQVTIGSNTIADSKGRGAPTVGANCYIGAGAKIIGQVTIGDNCRIGANCVVVHDLPPHSVAVPARPSVVVKTDLDNRYHSKRHGRWMYFADGRYILETDPEILSALNGERGRRQEERPRRERSA